MINLLLIIILFSEVDVACYTECKQSGNTEKYCIERCSK